MRKVLVWFGSACLCGLVTACDGTDDVHLGEEGSGINVGRCYGDGTRCDAPGAPRSVDPEPLPECVPTERTPLTKEFGFNLETTFCVTLMDCQFEATRLATAPDGSAWVLGYVQQGDFHQKFTLSRFTADGTLAGNTDVIWTSDRYTGLAAELDVDDEGRAQVVWYSRRSPDADAELEQRVVVETFDASLQRVGDPVTFIGASETLVQAAGGKLALAGNKGVIRGGGWAGVLDASGSLLWNQSHVNSGGNAGVTALAFAPDASATVLMDRGSGDGVRTRFGLSHFGPNGNALWDLNLTSEFEAGYHGALARDGQGNFAVGLFLKTERFGSGMPTLLEKFDSAGQLRWAMNVEAGGGGVAPVLVAEPESSRLLVAAGDGLLAIAGDGSSCHAYVYGTGLGSARAIALGAARDVYAIDQRELVRYSGLLP